MENSSDSQSENRGFDSPRSHARFIKKGYYYCADCQLPVASIEWPKTSIEWCFELHDKYPHYNVEKN